MTSSDLITSSPLTRAPSGRGRAALGIDWWPAGLPAGTKIEPKTLIAHDGEVSRGVLYTRGNSRAVFCLMHPRVDMQRHPFVVTLLEQGHAVWAQCSREVGNDLRLVHETALFDVAAGMEFLRELGYEKVVLIGMSGGAGLYSFYTEQSQCAPADRIASTPAGDPTGLGEASMPSPDALALIAPHPGQGRLLLGCIDGSVADESDPFSLIPELDPFSRANGFGDSPEGSTFSADFLSAYRQAQRDRVQRIDDRARELIEARRAARRRVKGGEGNVQDRRISILSPIITTYRTDADPRCTDLSLDPSDRAYGSVISGRPSVSNYGTNGFGRLTTPESWLSTWSGLSSNAAVTRSLSGVTVPTLVIEFTGDCSVFPQDVRDALDSVAADDVTHQRIRAEHSGRALAEGEESGIDVATRTIQDWSSARDIL